MLAYARARDGRDNNFHLIRHAAALAVVLTHSFSVVSGRFDSEPLVQSLGHSIGNYAVDVFFVLSGFLVTQSLVKDGDLVRFAASRALRIVPALVVTVLGCALVLGPLTSKLTILDYFSSRAWVDYILGTLSTLSTERLLPGVFETLPQAGRINVPLWTLKYELTAYASLCSLAMLSAWMGARSFGGGMVALLTAYIVGRFVFPWPATANTASNALHFLLSFYLGVAAFMFRERLPLSLLGVAALAISATIVHETPVREFFEKLAITYAVLYLAFVPKMPMKPWITRVDISYGLYILAYPVQQTIRLLFPEIGPASLFMLTLIATVPLAVLSWHVVERPALMRRERAMSFLSERLGPLGKWLKQPH